MNEFNGRTLTAPGAPAKGHRAIRRNSSARSAASRTAVVGAADVAKNPKLYAAARTTAVSAAARSTIASVKRLLGRPRFDVALVEQGDKHFYRIIPDETGPKLPADTVEELLPGVTGHLDVVAKPRLIGWAKKEALRVVERELLRLLKGKAAGQIYINTEILETIFAMARRRPDDIKKEAADIGTRAHAWIDAFIKGLPLPKLTPDIEQACNNFLHFWTRKGLIFVAGDTKIASLTYGFGGSLDWLAVDRQGLLVIGDTKTSNGIYPEYAAQVGGYAIGLYERFNIPSNRGLILRVSKDASEYEVGHITFPELGSQAFLAAKELKEILNNPALIVTEKINAHEN